MLNVKTIPIRSNSTAERVKTCLMQEGAKEDVKTFRISGGRKLEWQSAKPGLPRKRPCVGKAGVSNQQISVLLN